MMLMRINTARASIRTLAAQSHARPFAILVDEDHAGNLERGADSGEVVDRWDGASCLEILRIVLTPRCEASASLA